MIKHLLTLLAAAGVAAASYANNLNYRSPSHNHPALGVSIHKVNKRNAGSAPYPASQLNFTHGVASGDPYPYSVILWTRCAPMSDDVRSNSTVTGYVPLYNPVPIYGSSNETGRPSTAPICLTYKVSKDKSLSTIAHSGTVYTSSDTDYTVKVSVDIPRERTRNLVADASTGRSVWPVSLHAVLLSVQRLRILQRHKPSGTNQDHPCCE